jgi:hypothetical protein
MFSILFTVRMTVVVKMPVNIIIEGMGHSLAEAPHDQTAFLASNSVIRRPPAACLSRFSILDSRSLSYLFTLSISLCSLDLLYCEL